MTQCELLIKELTYGTHYHIISKLLLALGPFKPWFGPGMVLIVAVASLYYVKLVISQFYRVHACVLCHWRQSLIHLCIMNLPPSPSSWSYHSLHHHFHLICKYLTVSQSFCQSIAPWALNLNKAYLSYIFLSHRLSDQWSNVPIRRHKATTADNLLVNIIQSIKKWKSFGKYQ